LSFSANLSQAYIGKLERGERCPNIDTLYKISESLKISVCDLLIFNNSKTYPDSEITHRIESALKKVPQNKKISVVKITENITEIFE
ncbi:MAG: helix-turn-helix transcriptional regulator, partial [Ruminococcus sp.]|nr:helix-turn-helix transcriptional regulator [Ruminococcus sp.]